MEKLEYKLIKNKSGTFVYVLKDKQLFTHNSESKSGSIYLCKNRKTKCKCRIIFHGDICFRKNEFRHNHQESYEQHYQKLAFLSEIDNILINNMTKNDMKDSKQVYNSVRENFGIGYDEVKRTIQRRQREMLIARMISKPQKHIIQTTNRINGTKSIRVYARDHRNIYKKILHTNKLENLSLAPK